MTREQAFKMLGLTEDQLLDNVQIQSLLTQYAEDPRHMDSVIEGLDRQQIKVSNF